MSDRFFLDTNIIVYSFDKSNPTKQKRASELIEKILRYAPTTKPEKIEKDIMELL